MDRGSTSMIIVSFESASKECRYYVTDDEVRVVHTPPFADSVTEGDVRWDKGKLSLVSCYWDY